MLQQRDRLDEIDKFKVFSFSNQNKRDSAVISKILEQMLMIFQKGTFDFDESKDALTYLERFFTAFREREI